MKRIKKAISVLICALLVFGTVAVGGTGAAELFGEISAKASEGYSVGDIIYFGSYPQSDVTSSLGSVLNSQSGTWKSYNYYSGTGSSFNGQMTAGDYMQYCDITYNSNKYRGVTFETYRPYYTGYKTSASASTYQDDNGYYTGTTYWFKYEPLEWRVLDPSTGLVVCETIIDSQPFNNYMISNGTDGHGYNAYWGDSAQTYYASDYANSSIRKWLTEDFYATAFTSAQQSEIKTTILNNDGYYTLTGETGYEEYDSASTNDKIFLLSYDEVLNSSYGFSSSDSTNDSARQAKGSDYAKCQGLYVSNSYDGCSYWLLRSPGGSSGGTCGVINGGCVDGNNDTSGTNYGVRPALKLQNLSSAASENIAVDIPEGITDENYIGSEITGVQAGEGYTLSGTVAATDAGNYTATATLEDGYIWSDGTLEPKEINWSIGRRLIWFTAEASLDNDSFVYDGTAKEPELALLKDSYIQKELVEGVDYEIIHKEWRNNINACDPNEEDLEKRPTAVIAVEGIGNYKGSQDLFMLFEILKADPEVTAPVPVEGLKEDGSPKELVTPGSTTGGTLEYSLNGKDYSEEIPKASDEGVYTVYYRVTGDENYNDVDAQTVTASIGEKIYVVIHIVDGANGAIGYKEDKTFTANAEELPEGAEIHWFVNGEDVGAGESYTVEKPTEDYVVQAVVIDQDGNAIGKSEKQTVKVKNCFFYRLRWFFMNLWATIIKLFH